MVKASPLWGRLCHGVSNISPLLSLRDTAFHDRSIDRLSDGRDTDWLFGDLDEDSVRGKTAPTVDDALDNKANLLTVV